jgi:integrase
MVTGYDRDHPSRSRSNVRPAGRLDASQANAACRDCGRHEICRLLRAIDAFDRQSSTRIALQPLGLLFPRPGELRLAQCSEFDLDRGLWTIPASRMKMRPPPPRRRGRPPSGSSPSAGRHRCRIARNSGMGVEKTWSVRSEHKSKRKQGPPQQQAAGRSGWSIGRPTDQVFFPLPWT